MVTHAVVAKEYPKHFSVKFDLYHTKKNIGQVDIKYIQNNKDYKFKYVFPLIGKDFAKMIFGLSVSVAIVLAIHYYIIPKGLY